MAKLDEHCFIIISGIGKNNARMACEQLYQNGCNVVISWGTCAATNPLLTSGTLIVASKAMTLSTDEYCSDIVLMDFLKTQLQKKAIHYEDLPILQVDDTVDSIERKKHIYRKYNASIIDMESAEILCFAQAQNIKGLVIRSVCDHSDMILPKSILNSINEFGQMNFMRLFTSLILNPGDIVDLITLGDAYKSCSTSLKKCLPVLKELLIEKSSEKLC